MALFGSALVHVLIQLGLHEESVLTLQSAFLSTKPGNLYMEPVEVKLDGTISFDWRGCLLDFSSTPQDVVGQLGQPSSIMQVRVACCLCRLSLVLRVACGPLP